MFALTSFTLRSILESVPAVTYGVKDRRGIGYKNGMTLVNDNKYVYDKNHLTTYYFFS